MRIKSNYKVLLFALVLVLTVTLTSLHTKQPILTAGGDDLPIYIGTSIPRG